MKRQVRGGGPVAIGTDAQGSAEASRLWRRLGRADLRAVPEARRALRELLRDRGLPERREVAELLTSELVTNALVHTDGEAFLTAVVGERGVRVEVRDFVARPPRLLPADGGGEGGGEGGGGDGTHGRGLVLVQALADAWGVRAHGVGKAVWFEMGV
ncbi:ATP-binding protein [Streptomyces flavalbus]|uniref:ATP-binding protein n=1 Tax=Streptomyces flavalbus TaxID=2665155 RepID=A0ABW2WEZ9_9ACTN